MLILGTLLRLSQAVTDSQSCRLDLLDHPDALAEIRDEIDGVRKDELGDAPVWTRHALGELRLLDSFMRETHRMHPFTEGKSLLAPCPPRHHKIRYSH